MKLCIKFTNLMSALDNDLSKAVEAFQESNLITGCWFGSEAITYSLLFSGDSACLADEKTQQGLLFNSITEFYEFLTAELAEKALFTELKELETLLQTEIFLFKEIKNVNPY